MPHLDEGTIHALLDGELSAVERTAADAHLTACTECAARLAEERGLLSESDRLVAAVELPDAAPELPRRTSGSRIGVRIGGMRSLAWAASLVLAVGLGWAMSRLGTQARTTMRPAADTPASQVAAPVPAADVARPLNEATPAAPPAPAASRKAAVRPAPTTAKAESQGELVPRDELARRQRADAGGADREADLAAAEARLGTAVQQIDGMGAESVAVVDGLVRITYRDGGGTPFVLEQRRDVTAQALGAAEDRAARSYAAAAAPRSNSYTWRDRGLILTLSGPVSPDSLERLRSHVK